MIRLSFCYQMKDVTGNFNKLRMSIRLIFTVF